MKKQEEPKIYVVVTGTVQVPVALIHHKDHVHGDWRKGTRTVVQPLGRQAAQAAHVSSKLRYSKFKGGAGEAILELPITTIILQCRDSAELGHVFHLLFRKKLNPVIFSDTNPEYGEGYASPTAVAVHASSKQVQHILDYLPLFLKDVK